MVQRYRHPWHSVRDTYVTQALACIRQRRRSSPRARGRCPPLAAASGVALGGGAQAAAAARVRAGEFAAAAAGGCWGFVRVVVGDAGRAES